MESFLNPNLHHCFKYILLDNEMHSEKRSSGMCVTAGAFSSFMLGVGSQFHNVFSNLIFKYGREGVAANLR